MKQTINIQNLFLNFSLKCNMKCERCYGHLNNFSKDLMDFDTAKKATEFYFNNRNLKTPLDYIMIFGGEPLLNWDTVKKYISWVRKKYSNDLALFTNGLELNEEKIDFFINNKVFVFVSIDGDYHQHNMARRITREIFSTIVSMVRYFVEREPERVIPYCVVSKKDLHSLKRNISFIYSLGVHTISVAKDFGENWTPHERATLLEILRNSKIANFIIYPEASSDCMSCYPRQMMVYPNGEIYDLCYVCGTVLASKGLLDKKDLELFYMGNIYEENVLRLDVEKKKKTMHRLTFCPTITADYTKIEDLKS